MLPYDQCNKPDGKQDENWDVEESDGSFSQEFLCVFEHQSLEFSFVSPPDGHGDQDNCQQEADNCEEDLQSSIIRPETVLIFIFTYPIVPKLKYLE